MAEKTINIEKVYVNDKDRNGNTLKDKGQFFKKVTLVDSEGQKWYSKRIYGADDATLEIKPGTLTVDGWTDKNGYNNFVLLPDGPTAAPGTGSGGAQTNVRVQDEARVVPDTEGISEPTLRALQTEVILRNVKAIREELNSIEDMLQKPLNS